MCNSVSNIYSNSEILCKLTRKAESLTSERYDISEQDQNLNSVETEEPDTILCVLWKNGKLGSAYYKINSKQLYVLNDLIDLPPDFPVTRRLIYEVNIKHIITMGTVCDQFIKFIIDWISHSDNETVDSDQIRKLPENISLLPFGEYSYRTCEIKLFNLNLSSIGPNITDDEKEIYYRSLINFDSKLSVHALGALIKFVEKSWAHLTEDDYTEQLNFIDINQISLADNVFMDKNTLKALQIFQERSHDANFKHGGQSSTREGLSIFKLFSQYCKSMLGYQNLRRILLSPINNIIELNKRLDFIQFILEPTNAAFVDNVQENIKHISDVDIILCKIQHFRATSGDWEMLYKTIYHTLFLHELCGPYRSSSIVLSDLDCAITTDLYGLEKCISDALDFSNISSKFRPCIKFGLDEELDKKKLRRRDIGKHLTAAANFTVNQLPDFLEECTVIYIPEMGHLLAIEKSEQHSDPTQLEYLGFQFMFEINGTLHYKNPMCKELDSHLGHIHDDIIAHENRIITRLSGFILQCNKDIRKPLNIIAFIDSLISMAKVAKEMNYVRPVLNENNTIDIEEGRHALVELHYDNYVPNSIHSGGSNSQIKIITGPNSSGKSIFLKQTTLLVYLAHIGSYVSAKSASICMVHSIHSRIHATESASLRFSAFMFDLGQISQALHNANSTSLVVIDEFGRGTTGPDGLVLLASALTSFVEKNKDCPHIFVSTHYQKIVKYLPSTPLLSYLQMDHTRDKDDNILFLFKTVEGISESFAFDVALTAGLDKRIVDRARKIHEYIQNNTPMQHLTDNSKMIRNVEYEFYTNIDIPEVDE